MKFSPANLRCLFAATALFAALSAPASASAASIRTVLNGEELRFDVAPVIEQDRALVPVRGILEPLGAKLSWDQPTRMVTATLGDAQIRIALDDDMALVNGRPVALEVPARLIEGRTMVPLRFFAENLGFRVGWDAASRTVAVDSSTTVSVSRDARTSSRTGTALAELARTYIGVPYAWGGTSPKIGFDCSGFLLYVARQFGVELPRTSFDQYEFGVSVARQDLAAGDLVFFTTYAPGASHAGVYDGSGNFIHAGSEGTGVRITSMSNPYWAARYLGARRIVR